MEGSCKAEFLAREIVTRGPRFRVGVQLGGPEAVFEAIPEPEFAQTEKLRAEAGHARLLHNAGVDAEPIPNWSSTRHWGGNLAL